MYSKNSDASPDKSKDELERLLQESLRKQRPRRHRLALGILLSVAGIFAIMVWLLYPKGEPPHLIAVAFDDLSPAGKEVVLQGRLEPLADERAVLASQNMIFVDGQALLIPGQQAKEVKTKTGPLGEASCSWTFAPDAAQGNFFSAISAKSFVRGWKTADESSSSRPAPLCAWCKLKKR